LNHHFLKAVVIPSNIITASQSVGVQQHFNPHHASKARWNIPEIMVNSIEVAQM
jgi:hypothetical protein